MPRQLPRRSLALTAEMPMQQPKPSPTLGCASCIGTGDTLSQPKYHANFIDVHQERRSHDDIAVTGALHC